MTALIYSPSKSAMQSGHRGQGLWVLEFEQKDRKTADPLMGWSGSSDTRNQVRLRFHSLEEAVLYAQRQGLEYVLQTPQPRALKLQSYADNFR